MAAIVTNRRARYEYEILERFEAGLSLLGTEVKSLRAGGAVMRDAYAFVRSGEVFLDGVHIAPYRQASRFNHEPDRSRKLLLHRKQIAEIDERVSERGLTLVPLSLFWKDGKVKVELGLARGKNVRDKRAVESERDARREIDRAVKDHARA